MGEWNGTVVSKQALMFPFNRALLRPFGVRAIRPPSISQQWPTARAKGSTPNSLKLAPMLLQSHVELSRHCCGNPQGYVELSSYVELLGTL